MDIIPVEYTVAGLRNRVAAWRREGARIALVPTMGALHRGHLTLVKEATARADKVVVSIFVNPVQFAPHEDLDRYPRTLDTDTQQLREAGTADLVYGPSVAEMYPEGFSTNILVGGPGAGLETDFRPHFFAGVAIVVAKLFLQCRPDITVFGEKDYQQLLVVRRMARDLDIGIKIVGVPTVREADGLALSSRNAYLDSGQRRSAAKLNRILRSAGERARSGTPVPQAEAEAAAALLTAGFDRVDYVAFRDAETLAPLSRLGSGQVRILAAAWIGNARLIDNMAV